MSYPQQPPPGYGPPVQYPQAPGPYGAQPYPPPGHIVLPYPLAELGDRVVQGLIDALLQLIPFTAGLVLTAVTIATAVSTDTPALVLVGVVLFFLLAFAGLGVSFYNHVYRPAKTGTDQTFGMSKRNLKVVKLDGSAVTMGDHALRWLLLFWVEGGLIALILIASTARRQRLGDLAAKTVVVQLPSR